MTDHAQVRLEQLESIKVAHLEGEVDLSNAWSLTRTIVDAISTEDAKLVVDLTGVRYLDSAGIQILFDLSRRLGEHDQQLVVVSPPGALIRRSLEVSGLPRGVILAETLGDATAPPSGAI